MKNKCAFCGKEFDANRKYCTVQCRKLAKFHSEAEAAGRHFITVDCGNGDLKTLDLDTLSKIAGIDVDWSKKKKN